MRILAFSDIHGAFTEVENVLASEGEYDVVVLGGDLTTFGTSDQARQGIERLSLFGRPLLVVAGNMDPPELDQEFSRLGVSINARCVTLDTVCFFGVSAAPLSPLRTPNEIPEAEILQRAESGWKGCTGSLRTVFVPHAPPYDTELDRTHTGFHVGSHAVRQFIEAHQPDITICGHIHESRGIDRIGRTQIVNCGAAGKGYYAVLTLGEEVSVEMRG
jgi:Icc-related predicted phosphoesterase